MTATCALTTSSAREGGSHADRTALAAQFAVQGMRYAPQSGVLWCALCTTDRLRRSDKATHDETATNNDNSRDDDNDNDDDVCVVGYSMYDVLRHCATRAHLLLVERDVLAGLEQWLPVEVHGQRMLLDHHCVYPRSAWGGGRALLDETIAGGVVLGEDVCGGVKLWPCHKYTIVELLPSSHRAHVHCLARDRDRSADANERSDGEGGKLVAPHTPTCCVFYPSAALPPHLQRMHARQQRRRRDVHERAVAADDHHRSSSSNNVRAPHAASGAVVAPLPSFLRERQRVQSRRVYAARSAHALLQLASDAIAGEAALLRRRRRHFATNNYA